VRCHLGRVHGRGAQASPIFDETASKRQLQVSVPRFTDAARRLRRVVERRGSPRWSQPRDCGSSAMVRKTISRLPLSLAPRGLSRAQAAEYIGVGTTKFDEMVGDGRMPRAKQIDGRLVWDRIKLDEAFDALDDDLASKNEWDEL
jgi:predicted DNA-binding transcriptional regulator AlpA